MRKFADLGLIAKTKCEKRSEPSQDEIAEDYGVCLHDLILVLCQEMAGSALAEQHGRFIDVLKRSESVWNDNEIPTLEE